MLNSAMAFATFAPGWASANSMTAATCLNRGVQLMLPWLLATYSNGAWRVTAGYCNSDGYATLYSSCEDVWFL